MITTLRDFLFGEPRRNTTHVDVPGVALGEVDNWCAYVMHAIEDEPLSVAGSELMQLVDFALKTDCDEQFVREVRACVHMFWNRCNREAKQAHQRVQERLAAAERKQAE